jgi:adenylate kinase family enzyme
MDKIAIIGNGGGGKSTLAKAIASAKGLPILEVDHVQFALGWVRVDPTQVAKICDEFASQDQWIIDGFGPWESIMHRFALTDTIIFVDFPLWIHYWWAAERQIAAEKGLVTDGPPGCDYRGKTREMFEILWNVDQNIRPKILEEIEKLRNIKNIVHLRSPEEMEIWKANLIP